MRFILESDRLELFESLLGDVSMLPPGDPARMCLENASARELQAIEPIIERICQRVVDQKQEVHS